MTTKILNSLPVLVLLASVGGYHDGTVPPGYQGVVELDERQLAFELPGRIADVAVVRGQVVEAGAVVAHLDDSLERPQRDVRAADLASARAQADLLHAGSRPEEIRQAAAQLTSARATVRQVQLNLRRQRALAGSGAAPAARVDDLEADLERAQAEVKLLTQRLRVLRDGARPEEIAAADARVAAAKAALAAEEQRLARYTLHAPIATAVQDILLKPGEIAPAGAPVLLVADIAHPYVDAFVAQGSLGRLQIGSKASVQVDATSTRFPGSIEYMGSETEFTPRFLFSQQERPNLVIRVRVRIDDPQHQLHAGVPAFVTFPASGK